MMNHSADNGYLHQLPAVVDVVVSCAERQRFCEPVERKKKNGDEDEIRTHAGRAH